ncbi:SufB/SufD family protein [Leptospira jelokensis]|uniref:SufD family Fe-S cluster assembly protein n=1 Tax=Leptospira jelokensis TaxID=2484931 RepID=A0A4Z1A4A5_9LEPT|nr:SufD family Fe-S cluster assembly protein [Leptospira jelokensis]TGL76545.1 SufD family Fe-S cluster assembly protein [Leptospira jelokensis]
MNSSLKTNQFTINPALTQEFCQSLKKDWETISFPTEKMESFRKFPISSIPWEEVGFDPTNQKIGNLTENKDPGDSKTEPLLSETKQKEILDLIKSYLPKDFFVYLSILKAPQISISLCDGKFHLATETLFGDDAKFLFRIFYVPKGCSTQIQLKTETKHETESLHLLSVFDVWIAESDSVVEILDEENLDEDLIQFRSVFVLAKENASLKFHHFPFGGFRSKWFLTSHLLGKGGEVTVDGVSAIGKRNLKDMDMEMHHHADHTTSKISYKAIVTDRSHHVFTGNLIIPPNLRKVVAHQESFNLSLNKKARAEANPKLEVLAEDVSCTHGATVGDIDEEQFFYLLSRGLTPEESKSLLVTAFYGETIQSIGFDEETKRNLESSIHTILVGGK